MHSLCLPNRNSDADGDLNAPGGETAIMPTLYATAMLIPIFIRPSRVISDGKIHNASFHLLNRKNSAKKSFTQLIVGIDTIATPLYSRQQWARIKYLENLLYFSSTRQICIRPSHLSINYSRPTLGCVACFGVLGTPMNR